MKTYNITPVAKPRMTRSDKWRKKNHKNPKYEIRPCVEKYWAFKDECKLKKVQVKNGDTICFILPMAKSWSKKKKEKMCGCPHTQTPDVDNLCKAILDSVYNDDSGIYDLRIVKMWGYKGEIAINSRNYRHE